MAQVGTRMEQAIAAKKRLDETRKSSMVAKQEYDDALALHKKLDKECEEAMARHQFLQQALAKTRSQIEDSVREMEGKDPAEKAAEEARAQLEVTIKATEDKYQVALKLKKEEEAHLATLAAGVAIPACPGHAEVSSIEQLRKAADLVLQTALGRCDYFKGRVDAHERLLQAVPHTEAAVKQASGVCDDLEAKRKAAQERFTSADKKQKDAEAELATADQAVQSLAVDITLRDPTREVVLKKLGLSPKSHTRALTEVQRRLLG